MITNPSWRIALTVSLGILAFGCNRSNEYQAPQPTAAPAPTQPPANIVQNTYETPAQPVVVEQAPPDQVAIINEAPPPAYVEVVPASPGPDFVWVGGYWVVSGRRWVWVHGHYDRPPNHGAVWVGGGYEHHGDRYEFHAGHWR